VVAAGSVAAVLAVVLVVIPTRLVHGAD
jgi:hypothetical protein